MLCHGFHGLARKDALIEQLSRNNFQASHLVSYNKSFGSQLIECGWPSALVKYHWDFVNLCSFTNLDLRSATYSSVDSKLLMILISNRARTRPARENLYTYRLCKSHALRSLSEPGHVQVLALSTVSRSPRTSTLVETTKHSLDNLNEVVVHES